MQSVPIITEFKSRSGGGVQHYLIKFVNDMRISVAFWGRSVSSTNKTDLHDITEIYLKMALITIKKTPNIVTLFR